MNRQHSEVGYSYLFSVRLWREGRGDSNAELRGEVRHVLSGETRYFREWNVLTGYLTDKVNELERKQPDG
jgi:hypothetical protein